MNPLRLLPREQCTKLNRFRNINLMSIAYALRLGLGPTNPGSGNLALTAERILTSLMVTHSSILTSYRSTEPSDSTSPLIGTLLYHYTLRTKSKFLNQFKPWDDLSVLFNIIQKHFLRSSP